MSSHKHINLICLAAAALTLVLTLLFMNGQALGLRPLSDDGQKQSSGPFAAADVYDSRDYAGATEILLQGDTARIIGGGAYFHEGRVVIAGGGRYRLSGELYSGPVLVDAEKNSKVFLLLDGVELCCSDEACLWVEQADKVILSLAEGSSNLMQDSASRSEEAELARHDGVIFSRDDLSINGPGELTLVAGYRHGIDAHDDLVMTGGRLQISAPRDALHVNDSIRLRDTALTLEAGHMGLSQELPGGRIYIESGSLTVDSTDDALHSAGELTILGGRFALTSGDDALHCLGDLLLSGGTLSLTGGDDAIHSAGNLQLSDGALELTGGDDAVRVDGSFRQSGGKLTVSDCREGVEASEIRISGGELQIRCRVNGLNAALPTDAAEPGTLRPLIMLSGGSVSVLCPEGSHADGLDSNGDILITGGALLVSMANNKGNCALDWGREHGGICRISGGTVLCLDSGAMDGVPDTGSKQGALLYGLSAGRTAGSRLALEDEAGQELMGLEAPCSYACVLFSSPQLTPGTHVRLLLDGLVRELSLEEGCTVQGVFPS